VRERPSSMEDLFRLLEFCIRRENGGAGRDRGGGDGNNLQLPIILQRG
jgi:N-methylhydantoinase B/oxoprolinase/acetone carboxylase alpha subunit